MHNLFTRTVREIAVESPSATRVFEEYKIDYCCRGNTPFEKACQDAGADPEEIGQKILDVLKRRDANSAADTSLSDLVAHILENHHVCTKQELEQLTPLMAKVARRHGEIHPELFEIRDVFQEICNDLGPHMSKEEMVLFPYIIQLEASLENDLPGMRPRFGTVDDPISIMAIEHEAIGSLLSRMRRVSNDYEVPKDACPSFTALYCRLADLELDLHQHIHLENNVLFPKAIAMEVTVFNRSNGLF